MNSLFGISMDTILTITLILFPLMTAVVAALGTAVITRYELAHGIWLPLTSLVILQPEYGGTITRALQRTFGTIAGAIVGEFIASERGLGYLMIQVQSSLDTPAMVMAVVLLTLLGVALYGLVLGLERLFVVRDVRLQ